MRRVRLRLRRFCRANPFHSIPSHSARSGRTNGRDRVHPRRSAEHGGAAARGTAGDRPSEGNSDAVPPRIGQLLHQGAGRHDHHRYANTYLYLVLGNGQALRYGIGVGREGFTWAGAQKVSRMAEWPDWNPPDHMIERQPYLPRFMAGGEGNPLGARALYLGDTLYRIHGTNQPSTIGTFVSSGCIRLTNEDITDLYSRVKVGTRVVVLPGRGQTTGLGSSGRNGLPRQAARRPSSSGVPSSSDSAGQAIDPGETPGRARARNAEAHRRRRGQRYSRACPCVQGPTRRRRIRGVAPRSAGTVPVSRLGFSRRA